MYVKDGATVLADNLRILGGILSRPVVLFAFKPLKDTTLSTGIDELIMKLANYWPSFRMISKIYNLCEIFENNFRV